MKVIKNLIKNVVKQKLFFSYQQKKLIKYVWWITKKLSIQNGFACETLITI